jgi:single-strand DNA-binding protein
MINTVTLVGYVGRDPEIRYTKSGTAVANFSIATNRKVKRGEAWETETDWHDVVAWARTAETVERYVHKGKLIAVLGRLGYDEYEDKNGSKQKRAKVHVSNLTLLSKREGGKEGGRGGREDDLGGPWDEEAPY